MKHGSVDPGRPFSIPSLVECFIRIEFMLSECLLFLYIQFYSYFLYNLFNINKDKLLENTVGWKENSSPFIFPIASMTTNITENELQTSLLTSSETE